VIAVQQVLFGILIRNLISYVMLLFAVVCTLLDSVYFSDSTFQHFVSVNPIAWAVPTAHEGDASEEASLADETLASEVVLTRKRKVESFSSVEPNHLSDELEPKLADAQNGESN
jgi:hypothetical protein